MQKINLIIFIVFICLHTSAQETLNLWDRTDRTYKQKKSKLSIFLPEKQNTNGVSVIICPGGSYAHLYGIEWEGFEVAKWLNSVGITAFVLQYRVGKDGNHHPAMIEDVQRALQLVKTNSKFYGISPDKVGVMGLSAGGHLALMAGAFYKHNYLNNMDIPSDIDLKPAFVVPVYSVVSMQDSIAHLRSRKNLFGKKFGHAEKNKFSMELQMTQDMPPIFLVATKDDPVVSYKNSLALENALKKENITHKFLLYNTGGHGFGINEQRGGESANWKNSFRNWLYEIGVLK